MKFTRAERKRAKLRLAITGVSGSGKTYGALRIATGMGGRIVVIDTEHESSSLYANEFEFDSSNLDRHTPQDYINAINAAVKAGYDTVIIDSLTHMWVWCKAEADRIAAKSPSKNIWAAYSSVTPQYEALMNCIVQSDIHIITTIRSKSENVMMQVNGKSVIKKIGLKTEMKNEAEFEFTTVIDIDHETNGATASKDRTHIFGKGENIPINEGIGELLMQWLMQGVSPYIDGDQLAILKDMLAQISNEAALGKINNAYPDFSKLRANEFDNAVGRMSTIINRLAEADEQRQLQEKRQLESQQVLETSQQPLQASA